MAFTIKAIRGLLSIEDQWTTKLVDAANKTTQFANMTEKTLDNAGRKMTAAGATLTAAVTLPIAGLAAASLKLATDFESVMNRVEAAMGNPDPAVLNRLRDAAHEMGAATVFSSREAAEAMVELGKAGFDAEKTISALPSVLQLAVAGQLSLAEAATMASNTMSTFSISAEGMSKANDIIAKAAASSTIDVRDLADSFKHVGPLASTVKYSLEEVSGALALLGTAGIKGEMGGTGIRAIIESLINPTDKQVELMKQLGLETVFAGEKLASLPEIIERFSAAGGGAGEAMALFGQRGGGAFLKLREMGVPALEEMNQKLRESDGFAKQVAETYMKGLPGALERAKGSLETAGIALGSLLVPALEATANAVEKVANFVTIYIVPAFASIPTPIQVTIGVLVAVAAALGPLIAGFGLLATGIASLMPIVAWLGGAAGIMAVLTPIGLVVTAVVGLTTAWSVWGDDIVRIVSSTYAAVKEWLVDKWEGSIFQSIARMLQAMGELWVAIHVKILEVVTKIAAAVILYLVDKLKPVYDFVKPFIDTIAGAWNAAKDKIVGIVTAIFTGVKTWLVDKFTAIVDAIKSKIDAVTNFFKDMKDKVVGNSYVPDMVNLIADYFGQLDGKMVKPAQMATDLVSSMFSQLGTGIAQFFGGGEGVQASAADFFTRLGGSVQSGWGGVKSFLSSEASTFTKDFLGTMLSFIPGVGPIVSKLAGPIVEGVKNIFGNVFSGNETKKMFTQAFGNLDAFHAKLLTLGSEGEQFWIRMTQKTGKHDTNAAMRLIDEIQSAFSRTMHTTEQELSDTGADMTDEAQKLHNKIWDIMGKPLVIPYSFEPQNDISMANRAASTSVPSGASSIAARDDHGRPVNITMNIDGRTAARTMLPFLPDEVELSTA
jgi:TP901 family phage tail tape measure protein